MKVRELLAGTGLLAAVAPASLALAQVQPAPQPTNASRVLAGEIVMRLHTDRQIALLAPKLAPLFAIAVLDKVRKDTEAQSALASYLTTPDGEAQVKAALTDAFTTAFVAHVPDVLAVLADRYARTLSPDELRSLLAFIKTPAGVHWAALNGSFQQAASEEGARVGAIAGADAVSAALKALAAKESAK